MTQPVQVNRVLYVGPLWYGSTALQRCDAFTRLENIRLRALDSNERRHATLPDRVRHRLRWPADHGQINERLLAAISSEKFDLVFVDSCRLLNRATVQALPA